MMQQAMFEDIYSKGIIESKQLCSFDINNREDVPKARQIVKVMEVK
jgi:hypothetical protein